MVKGRVRPEASHGTNPILATDAFQAATGRRAIIARRRTALLRLVIAGRLAASEEGRRPTTRPTITVKAEIGSPRITPKKVAPLAVPLPIPREGFATTCLFREEVDATTAAASGGERLTPSSLAASNASAFAAREISEEGYRRGLSRAFAASVTSCVVFT